ncbi:hypothetical protein OG474_04640 [Kribbella sp. NBC_01505]|uniref:hypothetical protein n=1 Tax=Kribbella sp. NBC_01505 TaxID=2903580 RepID=UPI00386A48DA
MSIKRWGTVAAALVLGITGSGIAATQAWASNASSNRCISVFVEYVTQGDGSKYVYWAESRNICGAFAGHFQTAGVNGADTNPIQTHRVNFNRVLPRGSCIQGIAWKNNGGQWSDVGNTCTLIA